MTTRLLVLVEVEDVAQRGPFHSDLGPVENRRRDFERRRETQLALRV